jgi:hypothetical protein
MGTRASSEYTSHASIATARLPEEVMEKFEFQSGIPEVDSLRVKDRACSAIFLRTRSFISGFPVGAVSETPLGLSVTKEPVWKQTAGKQTASRYRVCKAQWIVGHAQHGSVCKRVRSSL